jgi:hypothetical protein
VLKSITKGVCKEDSKRYQYRVEAEALPVPMRSDLFRLKATKRGKERSGGIALAGSSTIFFVVVALWAAKGKMKQVTKEFLAVTGGASIRRDERMQAKGIGCCRPWAKWFSCYTQLLVMHKSNNDRELVGDVS